jgi:hypothetical protein
VVARSKAGFAAPRLSRWWFRIPQGTKSVSCECSVLSGIGLCYGQMSRVECRVSECVEEAVAH